MALILCTTRYMAVYTLNGSIGFEIPSSFQKKQEKPIETVIVFVD